MKQKLFENVGGNSFKLITESVDEVNPNTKHVREGLKKVFGGAEGKPLSYKRLQGVGIGYIKSVAEAQKTAIQEARILAKEYGYVDNENSQKFVKEDGEMSDFDREEYENGRREPVSSPGKAGPEESRAVQIGKRLSTLASQLDTTSHGSSSSIRSIQAEMRELAQELIQMPRQPYIA